MGHGAVMTLNEYLTLHNESAKDFAVRAGLSPAAVSRFRNGETWPDKRTAEAILLATDQKVTPNDFLPALRADGVTGGAAD